MSASLLPWLQAPAEDILARHQGHALLLQAAEGLGGWQLAHHLAASWLCEAPVGSGHACGECASCRLVGAFTHPDLQWVVPEAIALERGWLPEGAEDDGKASKSTSKAKPSREIKVDALRKAVAFSQQSSSRGGHKVVLIYPADAMNHIAANTLLKTLEEPPGDTKFILLCAQPHQLLPTIRSRCQTRALSLPQAEVALGWLTSQGLSAVDAQTLLAACGDLPLDALALAQSGVKAEHWNQWPSRLAKGQWQQLPDWTPAQWVPALQKLGHDLLVKCHGATPRYFSPQALDGLAPGEASLHGWLDELRDTQRQVDHTWNAGLMTEHLVRQARSRLNSKA